MRGVSRNHYKREDAQNLLHCAEDSIGIPDPDGVYAYRIRINVQRLRDERTRLLEIEGDVVKRSAGNQDIANISGIKRMGAVNVSTIVSEIGDIGQFNSAVKLQAYGGKAPNLSGSGGESMQPVCRR